MIELKQAIYEYKLNNPIGPFDLVINDKQIHLLTGKSGCGKTTITRMINGIIPNLYEGRLTGEVLINGKNTKNMKMYEFTQNISSVFQNPKTQFFTTNTASEMAFPLENLGFSRKETTEKINKITDELGIWHIMNRSIFELSGGEKQILCLAICFITGSKVVVMDEPTGNLDLASIQKVKKMLVLLKSYGKTIIISEHRIEYLMDLIDTVSIIDNGQIIKSLSGLQFKSMNEKERMNLGLRTFSPIKNVHRKNTYPSKINIKIDELEFKYKNGTMVLINDLILSGGKVVAITGKNGHGKSTFVKLLSGLKKPLKENIRINGEVVNYKKRLDKCYMVLQDVNTQLFTTSIEEEIMLGSTIEDPTEILKSIRLFHKKEEHPLALSGGEKQRVSLAAGIASGREIFIADEPTSGMDFQNMSIVGAMLNNYAKQGNIVLLISHDIELISEVADEIIYMEEGRIIWAEEKDSDVLKRLVDSLEK